MSLIMNIEILIALSSGYFFGSIPFGLLLTKFAGEGDIRKIGSGNIGATNVLRTGHKSLAAATLILDAGKGAFGVYILGLYLPDIYLGIAGTSAVVGHCYPIWLKFSGGKGVATGLGIIAMLSPISGFLFIITWIIIAFLFRYSSLSALLAFFVSCISSFFVERGDISLAILFMTLIIFFRHKENIKRLVSGTESKILERS